MGSIISEFLRDNPEGFDNHGARINNQVYACAASWTKVHEIIDDCYPEFSLEDLRPHLSSLVRSEWANRLIEFLKRGLELSPTKILMDYKSLRQHVLNYVENGSGGDVVAAAATAAIRTLKSREPDDPEMDRMLKNFAKFYCDLPHEVAQNTALELAPQATTLEAKDVKVHRVENQETIERIQQYLMFQPEAREKLQFLNQIISKRSPAQTDS